jgi:acyl carrier protein
VTRDEVRGVVLRVLGEIAPEANLSAIKPDVDLREQLDVDSMDQLNFIIGLHEALHAAIPEADYPMLTTLDGCVDYLMNARTQ